MSFMTCDLAPPHQQDDAAAAAAGAAPAAVPNPDYRYDLVGLVLYSGRSVGEPRAESTVGHCVAHVKHNNRQWFSCNDSAVREISAARLTLGQQTEWIDSPVIRAYYFRRAPRG
jgi:ubiquitin C-terminal hydrolase